MSVIILGDKSVGKSNMISALCEPDTEAKSVFVNKDDCYKFQKPFILSRENLIDVHLLRMSVKLPSPQQLKVNLQLF